MSTIGREPDQPPLTPHQEFVQEAGKAIKSSAKAGKALVQHMTQERLPALEKKAMTALMKSGIFVVTVAGSTKIHAISWGGKGSGMLSHVTQVGLSRMGLKESAERRVEYCQRRAERLLAGAGQRLGPKEAELRSLSELLAETSEEYKGKWQDIEEETRNEASKKSLLAIGAKDKLEAERLKPPPNEVEALQGQYKQYQEDYQTAYHAWGKAAAKYRMFQYPEERKALMEKKETLEREVTGLKKMLAKEGDFSKVGQGAQDSLVAWKTSREELAGARQELRQAIRDRDLAFNRKAAAVKRAQLAGAKEVGAIGADPAVAEAGKEYDAAAKRVGALQGKVGQLAAAEERAKKGLQEAGSHYEKALNIATAETGIRSDAALAWPDQLRLGAGQIREKMGELVSRVGSTIIRQAKEAEGFANLQREKKIVADRKATLVKELDSATQKIAKGQDEIGVLQLRLRDLHYEAAKEIIQNNPTFDLDELRVYLDNPSDSRFNELNKNPPYSDYKNTHKKLSDQIILIGNLNAVYERNQTAITQQLTDVDSRFEQLQTNRRNLKPTQNALMELNKLPKPLSKEDQKAFEVLEKEEKRLSTEISHLQQALGVSHIRRGVWLVGELAKGVTSKVVEAAKAEFRDLKELKRAEPVMEGVALNVKIKAVGEALGTVRKPREGFAIVEGKISPIQNPKMEQSQELVDYLIALLVEADKTPGENREQVESILTALTKTDWGKKAVEQAIEGASGILDAVEKGQGFRLGMVKGRPDLVQNPKKNETREAVTHLTRLLEIAKAGGGSTTLEAQHIQAVLTESKWAQRAVRDAGMVDRLKALGEVGLTLAEVKQRIAQKLDRNRVLEKESNAVLAVNQELLRRLTSGQGIVVAERSKLSPVEVSQPSRQEEADALGQILATLQQRVHEKKLDSEFLKIFMSSEWVQSVMNAHPNLKNRWETTFQEIISLEGEACVELMTAYEEAGTRYQEAANAWSDYELKLKKLTPEQFEAQTDDIATQRRIYKVDLAQKRHTVQELEGKISARADRYPPMELAEGLPASYGQLRDMLQGFKPKVITKREIPLTAVARAVSPAAPVAAQAVNVAKELVRTEVEFLSDVRLIKENARRLLSEATRSEDKLLLLGLIDVSERMENTLDSFLKGLDLQMEDKRVTGTPTEEENRIFQMAFQSYIDHFDELSQFYKEAARLEPYFPKSGLLALSSYNQSTSSPIKYIQRLGKYPLLVREAIKGTPDTHPLYQPLVALAEKTGQEMRVANSAMLELEGIAEGPTTSMMSIFQRLDILSRATPWPKVATLEALREFRVSLFQHDYQQNVNKKRLALIEAAEQGRVTPGLREFYADDDAIETEITRLIGSSTYGEQAKTDKNREIALMKQVLKKDMTPEEEELVTVEKNSAEKAKIQQEMKPFPIDETARQALYERLLANKSGLG